MARDVRAGECIRISSHGHTAATPAWAQHTATHQRIINLIEVNHRESDGGGRGTTQRGTERANWKLNYIVDFEYSNEFIMTRAEPLRASPSWRFAM